MRSLGNTHSQTKNDIISQLENLFLKDTLTHANEDDLNQYPKYLKAILIRIDKTQYKFKDNFLFSAQISELLDLARDLDQNVNSELFEEIRSFKWAIEELRVSLFAQQLKTREPVSYKRLLKRWERLQEKLNVMSFQ
jgi:ATP-dependent helicase HrpA